MTTEEKPSIFCVYFSARGRKTTFNSINKANLNCLEMLNMDFGLLSSPVPKYLYVSAPTIEVIVRQDGQAQ